VSGRLGSHGHRWGRRIEYDNFDPRQVLFLFSLFLPGFLLITGPLWGEVLARAKQ